MGVLGGMAGVGGGVLAIPLLTSWVGVTQHQAHGTSLAAVMSTGFIGASTYYLMGDGSVDLFAAAVISPCAALFSIVGVRFCNRASPRTLKLMMATFTLSAAMITGWREYISRNPKDQSESEEIVAKKESPVTGTLSTTRKAFNWEDMKTEIAERTKNPNEVLKFLAFGTATGIIAGLLGVGGGVVLLPLLTLGTDMPQQLIFGTVLAAFVPVTVIGTISHARSGNVVWRLMPGLFLGSALGAYVGSRISIYLSEPQQRGVVIAVMTSVGIKALLK